MTQIQPNTDITGAMKYSNPVSQRMQKEQNEKTESTRMEGAGEREKGRKAERKKTPIESDYMQNVKLI